MRSISMTAMAATLATAFFCLHARGEGGGVVKSAADDPYQNLAMLMDVIQLVRQDYVDSSKTEYKTIVTNAIKGVMSNLDPHSAYLAPKNYKSIVEDTIGQDFAGIGAEVRMNRDRQLEVITPMEDMPAQKAGLLPGDVILEVDGEPTSNRPLEECIDMLRGDPGTEVRIKIAGDSGEREVVVVRDRIETTTVKGRKIIGNGVGYVRITQFADNTGKDLLKALQTLKAEGVKALVIDLRDNPGGLLQAAIEVCSLFIPTGQPVVSTQGRVKSQNAVYNSGGAPWDVSIPMAVLVNRNSASAAEIVAGCLKDHRRALVVGERTYGKGTVQNIVPLPGNRGAVKITTAKYHTPNMAEIDGEGVPPDILSEVDEKTLGDLFTQRLSYPGVINPGKKDTVKDVQLERAVELLKGVCIFTERQ